jgi:hypothetical protein
MAIDRHRLAVHLMQAHLNSLAETLMEDLHAGTLTSRRRRGLSGWGVALWLIITQITHERPLRVLPQAETAPSSEVSILVQSVPISPLNTIHAHGFASTNSPHPQLALYPHL